MKGRYGVALALLGFFAGTGTLLQAQDATKPFEKYVAWRGGAAFERIRAISERGSIDADGMRGDINRVLLADGRYQQSVRFPAYTQTDVVSSEGAWTTNPSGQVVRLSPGQASDLRRLAQLAFPIFADNLARIRLQELAPERRDGKQWSVVRVRFGGRMRMTFSSRRKRVSLTESAQRRISRRDS